LVAESEGGFDMDIWERAADKARVECSGHDGGDVSMEVPGAGGLERFMIDTAASKIAADQQWKEDIK